MPLVFSCNYNCEWSCWRHPTTMTQKGWLSWVQDPQKWRFESCHQVTSKTSRDDIRGWGKFRIGSEGVLVSQLCLSAPRSATQLCPTLHDPIDCSMPGLPVHHQLPEFTQTHVPLRQWCHPANSSSVVPFSSCLQSFPVAGAFPTGHLFTSGAKVLELQLQHQSFQWIFRTDFL